MSDRPVPTPRLNRDDIDDLTERVRRLERKVLGPVSASENLDPDGRDWPRAEGGFRPDGGTVDSGRGFSEPGPHGVARLLVDKLGNEYRQIGKDLKAKVWLSDDGERRLYLRVRDSDDRRKFNEFSLRLSRCQDTLSSREARPR